MTDAVQALSVTMPSPSNAHNKQSLRVDGGSENLHKSPLLNLGDGFAAPSNCHPVENTEQRTEPRAKHHLKGQVLGQQLGPLEAGKQTLSLAQQSASGRCNPEPAAFESTNSEKNRATGPSLASPVHLAAVKVSATTSIRNAQNDKILDQMTDGRPAIDVVKVPVIRPYAVKKAVPLADTTSVPSMALPPHRSTAHIDTDHSHQILRSDNEMVSHEASVALKVPQVQKNRAQPEGTAPGHNEGHQYITKSRVETQNMMSSQCDFPVNNATQAQIESTFGVDARGDMHPNMVSHTQYSATGNNVHHQQGEAFNGSKGFRHQQNYSHTQVPASITAENVAGIRRQPNARSISVSSSNIEMDVGHPASLPPTPLFERLHSEDVQEIKTYARMIESQNRKLGELKRTHEDLEQRLQNVTLERMQLESTLEERERGWSSRFDLLEKERDKWKEKVKVEEEKNEKLVEILGRKDMDIHRMLARKYDQHRDHHISHSLRNYKAPHIERSGTPPAAGSSSNATSSPKIIGHHKSPHEIVNECGSIEDVRERNVAHSLLDFFGM